MRLRDSEASARVRRLIRGIRLLVFDFDGVFTDNTVLVSEDGSESVRCWRGDGLGLEQLRRLGLDLLILSTETNPVVSARARKLGIPCLQGSADKRAALEGAMRDRGLGPAQVAYVGNDVNDLSCLALVGLPIVVHDAEPAVVAAAKWRTRRAGGHGAVRDVCNLFAKTLREANSGHRVSARHDA